MWLINTTTLKLEYFVEPENAGVHYAILSHTWGSDQDEVTFQQFANLETARHKAGFAKIQKTCDMARAEGLAYAWVDTCCIDKSSSAELSEAINSMFSWYRASTVCYAFLSDLYDKAHFRRLHGFGPYSNSEDRDRGEIEAILNTPFAKCKWFTRGWTLQELIAPARLTFYDADWHEVGDKIRLSTTLEHITNVASEVLTDSTRLIRYSVWGRMSWAARRQTTRTEDIAYCLLGIFDVNMPLIYGEGYKAFQRLQEEITRKEGDPSILAWSPEGMPPPAHRPVQYRNATTPPEIRGAFAWAPSEFVQSSSAFTDSVDEQNIPNSFRYTWTKLEMGAQSSVIVRCGSKDVKLRVFTKEENVGIVKKRRKYVELPTTEGFITRDLVFNEGDDGFAFRSIDTSRKTFPHVVDEEWHDHLPLLGNHRAMFIDSSRRMRVSLDIECPRGSYTITDVWPEEQWEGGLFSWVFTERHMLTTASTAPSIFGIARAYVQFQEESNQGDPEVYRQHFAFVLGADIPRTNNGTPQQGSPGLFAFCVAKDKVGDRSWEERASILEEYEAANWARNHLFDHRVNLSEAAAEIANLMKRSNFAVHSGGRETTDIVFLTGPKLRVEVTFNYTTSLVDTGDQRFYTFQPRFEIESNWM